MRVLSKVFSSKSGAIMRQRLGMLTGKRTFPRLSRKVLIRSLKTFVLAALAFASTALSTGNIVYDISQTLVLSALAVGIAAVWNGVLSPALKAVHEKDDQEIGE